MVIVAYVLSAHDNDSHFLGGPTFRPPPDAGFHDWRFGTADAPHPATCANCGRRTDLSFVEPTYRAPKRKWAIGSTYDGETIVSEDFRRFCAQQGLDGVRFLPLPADPDFFALRVDRVLAVDVERTAPEFDEYCTACGHWYSITGPLPLFLKDVAAPIARGIYRTDLAFACGPEQSPLLLLDTDTAARLREAKFKNFHLEPVRI